MYSILFNVTQFTAVYYHHLSAKTTLSMTTYRIVVVVVVDFFFDTKMGFTLCALLLVVVLLESHFDRGIHIWIPYEFQLCCKLQKNHTWTLSFRNMIVYVYYSWKCYLLTTVRIVLTRNNSWIDGKYIGEWSL